MSTAVHKTIKAVCKGTMPFVVYNTYLMPQQTSQSLQQLQLFLYSMCIVLPIAGCSCHKGLFQSTIATLVINAIAEITNLSCGPTHILFINNQHIHWSAQEAAYISFLTEVLQSQTTAKNSHFPPKSIISHKQRLPEEIMSQPTSECRSQNFL